MCLKSVDNCKTLDYFDSCSKCNDGYFVGSNGRCIKNPLTEISDCLQYTSATECKTCVSGYYLELNLCIQQNIICNSFLKYNLKKIGIN